MAKQSDRVASIKRASRNRTRAAVRELMEGATDPSRSPAELARLNEHFERDRDGFFEVMVEILEDPDPRFRVYAALGIRMLVSEQPELDRDNLEAKAKDQFREALAAPGSSEQLVALFLLANGAPGDEIVEEQLRNMLQDNSERSVCAAAALSSLSPGDSVIMRVLRLGLGERFQGTWVEVTAARALSRLGIASAQPASKLAARLESGDAAYKYWVLCVLRDMGVEAVDASDALTRFVNDTRAESAMRALAAKALAEVSVKKPGKAEATLRKLLSEEDADLIAAAALGLVVLKRLTERDVKDVSVHLGSANDLVRRAAAWAIDASGPLSAVVLEALVECARTETNVEVMCELADACARSGVAVIPVLIDSVRDSSMPILGLLGMVASRLGDAGIVALAECLSAETDVMCRGLLLVVMRELQDEATPAIPVIAQLLTDSTTDVEFKILLIKALESIGPHALAAVPALTQCLESPDKEVASWTRRALARIDSVTAGASGVVGRASVVDSGQAAGTVYEKLAPLPDSVLLTFVYVCRVMGKERVGLYTVAKNLKELQTSGDVPANLRITNQSLGNSIRKLESALGVELLRRAPKQKGAITDAGWRHLPIIKEYLQKRNRTDGRGH